MRPAVGVGRRASLTSYGYPLTISQAFPDPTQLARLGGSEGGTSIRACEEGQEPRATSSEFTVFAR